VTFELTVGGLDQIRDSLQAFSWMTAAAEWADEVGPVIRDAVKDESPVAPATLVSPEGGRLKKSIRYQRSVGAGSAQLLIYSTVPYAGYVIDGTQPHIIRYRNARFLRFAGQGQIMFRKQVNHPGTQPNDFPERAVTPMVSYIQQTFSDIVEAQFLE